MADKNGGLSCTCRMDGYTVRQNTLYPKSLDRFMRVELPVSGRVSC